SNHPDHELAILKRAEIAADRGAQSEGRTMLFDALQRNLSSELLSRTYFRFCDDSDKWPEEMQQLVDACGNDTDRIVAIGDMAIRVPVVSKANWDRAIRSVEDRLKRIEGTDGIAWRIVSAKRILAITNLEPTTDLAPAREIASFLIAKSPSLGAGYAISGAVADRGNQTTEAMYQYQKAVALGENDFSIHERLCELLYQNGRLDEAKALIDRMGVNRDASPRVASIALEMANDQPDRLLEIARSGIRTRPKDPMAWVWYASVLESESRDRTDEERADLILEATGAIDKGVAIAPADLRVINADFNFSSMTKQIDRLPKIMARLRIADSVPPLQKYIALGRMEFVSGDIEASIANYRSALEIGGDPIELTILIAKSQQRQRKFAEAIESLEVVYPKAPEHEGLRHMLASALASRGTPADWERIPSMLTSPPFGNNPSDLKLLANLHTQRGFASDLTIAKMLLERLIPKPERATGEELFQLGMVSLRAANLQLEANNQSEANWLRSEAEKYLRQSISQDPSNRDFRYVYGTLLLELHREAMALEQARQLRQIDRDGFEANLLLARALHATGDNQGGIGLMSQWLQGEMGRYSDPRFTTQRLASMGRGAVGFMMLGAKDRTESLLKEMDESSPSSSFAILATLLGVEDISLRSKALQLLLAYGTSVGLESPLAIEIGTVIARSLVGKKLDEDAKKTGEAFLRDMQTRHPEQLELQRAVSDYWLLQNETEIAVECLRRVVKLTPNDPVVLNNLACLLGESVGGCAEGLQYIERAIELVGEVPDLLDSKGTILMRMGQLEEAGKIFEKAAETGGDPRIVLHWYLALKRANKVEEANRVRERIDRERLRRVPLNREEQQELAALK
ncbi:MAG: hypothetical protein FJ308_19775, partial [Planctomycetes bacterium]|nr:hypothetical protein [Planctomycetota bacterium]